MKKRKPIPSDQKNVEKAYQLLLKVIEKNQSEIEPTLWIGAMIAALAQNYKKSRIPFDHFRKEMVACVEHYKY